MSNLAEKLPEEIEIQATTLHDQALSIKVVDQATFAQAGEFGKSLKELEKKIVDFFAPLKKAAHEAHKAITKKESDELAPVTVAPKVETAKFSGGSVGQAKEVQITVTDMKAFMAEIVKRGMAPTMFEVKLAPLKAWQKANDIKIFPGLHIKETVAARIR